MEAFWGHSGNWMPLYNFLRRNSSQRPGHRVRRQTSTSCGPASARGQSGLPGSSDSASGERSDWVTEVQTRKLTMSFELPLTLAAAALARLRPRFVLGAGVGVPLSIMCRIDLKLRM